MIRHILTILAVDDVQRAVRFYADAFGWSPRVETAVYVELEMPGGRGLGLYQRESFAKNTGLVPHPVPAGEIGGAELYFHCDDLEAAVVRLETAGARLLSERAARDWGDEAAYYADPDGNVVVVAKPLP